MKLNLGCGTQKIGGYVNCDISPQVKPDLILNIEGTLPFKDNSVDEIVMIHVLEHVHNFIQLMQEIWRISEKNAQIRVRVPFYASLFAYIDPTHVRFFTPFTFDYFKQSHQSGYEVGNKNGMFDVKVRINFLTPGLERVFNPLININQRIYCRFFANIFPAGEISFVLTVLK